MDEGDGTVSGKPDRLAALLQALRTGTPRAAWHARKELAAMGRAAEAPVLGLLRESRDASRVQELLGVLQHIRIAEPSSVEAVVRLLHHEQSRVRAAAAECLLHSSPKLKPHLPAVQAALERESDTTTRHALQMLLHRYPRGQ